MAGRHSEKRTAIPIEEYRGYEIYYNEQDDKFGCFITENEKIIERQSLTYVKQAIDQFIKENEKFVPFQVISLNYSNVPKVYEVIAKRKDGCFVYLDENERRCYIDPHYIYNDFRKFDLRDGEKIRQLKLLVNELVIINKKNKR